MKSALNKDFIRDILKSKGRFLSIVAIVALGVAFFIGVKSSPIVMQTSSDKYYDDNNFMDIRLVSSMGLTDDDVNEIKKIKGIDGIFPTYSLDVMASYEDKDQVLKIHGLDINNINKNDKNYINQLTLVEGRLPSKSGECVVEKPKIKSLDYKIGTKIKLSSGNNEKLKNSLKTTEYTIVGYVNTPYYLSHEKGNSSIGSGVVDGAVMIPQSDFKSDVYTEVFLTVKGAKNLNTYSDEYFDLVKKVTDKIENIKDNRCEARYKEILAKTNKQIKNDKFNLKQSYKEIQKIEKPTWYILDRDSHQSFVEYKGCAESIDALAKVFPVFFFAVAALVCLTTMTRMVDEQRINIGTLKGLGYKNSQISKKYILYASVACIIGSVLGNIVGYTLFPTIIFFAYGMMYSIPNIIYIFSLPLSLGITIIALLVITTSAYIACYNELKEVPAVLMRPRPPKNGKRILLERIPFIWNKLSFISKVTVRNIFRYKKRFLMTVLGISGCTALILTGFGIKDSIEIIVKGQYGTLFKYDMSVVTKSDLSQKKMNNLKEDISKLKEIKDIEIFSYQNGDIKVNKTTKEITIVVPKNLNKMDEFIHLQDRKSQKYIKLDDSGAIITEKMARDLDVQTGDIIEIINDNNKKSKVKIRGITENYISHYIYMSPTYYKNTFKENLKYNRILGTLNNTNITTEDKLSKKLFKLDDVNGVSFNTSSKETFNYTIKNLNYVVIVMILSAGSLAFVVLYNLTNVNISERIREIATIKVLGFYDNEVSKYIYRENIILTIIGTIVGIILGKLLHQFIMVTVEIQSMMFGRVISIKSYFIAAILTIIMSCFVNLFMYYKLKNVKMVESLKSID